MTYLSRKQLVVLLRHGQTDWTITGQHTSRTELPLTEAGKDEARSARNRLGQFTFSRVLSSPMQRAVETCQLAGLSDNPELNADLCEWNYGRYEGLTSKEIHADNPKWSLWTDGAPDGESPQQVSNRADQIIELVRETDGDVALVGHGHFTRVLGARWVNLPAAEGEGLGLSTAAICVLGYEHANPVLWHWNETGLLSAP